MNIAQVAPLFESIPPVRYGSRGRVISYLTEELVNLGHDVTLFASADSVSNATIIPGCLKALSHNKVNTDRYKVHMRMLDNLIAKSSEFDVIHFHTDYLHYSIIDRIEVPHVTSHHGRIDIPGLGLLYRDSKIPVVAVSDKQRTSLPDCNWQGTVYNGVPENLYDYRAQHMGYLVFIGQISPEAGVMEAIEIAQRSNMNLKMAAKVDTGYKQYFMDVIKPILADPRIEFVGEINNTRKNLLLGDAYALLYPVKYPDPFALVMVEAMACGVPVISYRGGSVEEIIEHGVNGYVVDDLEGAIDATAKLSDLSRKKCYESFLRQFTARRMAENYLAIYHKRIRDYKPQRTHNRNVSNIASIVM